MGFAYDADSIRRLFGKHTLSITGHDPLWIVAWPLKSFESPGYHSGYTISLRSSAQACKCGVPKIPPIKTTALVPLPLYLERGFE